MLGVLFIAVQQSVVASSTALIARLTNEIMSDGNYMLWLILFVVSLTIVYIPTTLTNYFINKAKFITFRKYISDFSGRAYNNPGYYFNRNFREKKEPYFTHEAWMIIQENYVFIVDILSIFLNVFLNVLVLSIYLDWAFLLSYLFAVPLSAVCVLISKARLQRKSDSMQKSRNDMMQILNQGWDTVLIGNKWNMKHWKRRFFERSKSADDNQRSLALEIDLMSLITLIVSAIPILIVLFMSFMRASGNIQMLALLIATAPRQVITIQYLSDIVGLFVNLNDKVRRTKQLSANLDFENTDSKIGGIISWGKIFIEKDGDKQILESIDSLNKATNSYSIGRFIITGGNGCGKTTLLSKIKEKFGDNAFLLPNQSKMAFEHDEQQKEYSTGERTIKNLNELSEKVCNGDKEISVLLLDEWNANLDKGNTELINFGINSLSEKICIIEVLHRA